MLSRIAENLYWIGRFVERAEDIARLVAAHHYSTMQVGRLDTESHRDDLVAALGSPGGGSTFGDTAAWWVSSAENASSAVSCIRAARESARHAREVLSLEVWETLNGATAELDDLLGRRAPFETIAAAVPRWTGAYAGVVETTAPRDSTWAILRLGAMVERAVMTLQALSIGAESRLNWADDDPLTLHTWTVTLRACAALDAYRRATTSLPRGRTVAELLLRSPTCPRSVLFAVREAQQLVPFSSEAAAVIGEVRAELEKPGIEALLADAMETFHRLLGRCDSIHEAIVGEWRGRWETG